MIEQEHCVLSTEDNGEAFLRYVSHSSLDDVLEAGMFDIPDLGVPENRQRMLDDLAFIANIAIDDLVPWVTTDAKITATTTLDPEAVSVSAKELANEITVTIQSSSIETLVTVAICRICPHLSVAALLAFTAAMPVRAQQEVVELDRVLRSSLPGGYWQAGRQRGSIRLVVVPVVATTISLVISMRSGWRIQPARHLARRSHATG
jgi:hypothetical protein